MFLKEIQQRPVKGMMGLAFKKLREAGRTVPEIMHLFRFKKRNTDHLVRFTDQVMRGPSVLSWGLRELIGAYLSQRNQCGFCSCAHAPVAAQLLGQDLVEEVLRDPETSRLDAAHKALFRYIGKLADNPAAVTAADVNGLKALGWSEEAIYDALTVASLFKFYNTWNNGAGVQTMGAADYTHSGERLLTMGYCMDFTLLGILKVMWVGRKELRLSDVGTLFQLWLGSIWSAPGQALPPVDLVETPACSVSRSAAAPALNRRGGRSRQSRQARRAKAMGMAGSV